jgi:formate dehydrogenase major subunit
MGIVNLSRRGLFRFGAVGLAGSTIAALGFDPEPALAQVRPFKLSRTTETRNTCPYCSVSCGVIMYSTGDRSKNARAEIMHIEGDPDHPVNRGTLCPKGAALLDFVRSPTRVQHPMYRGPGERAFRRVTWDWAMERITTLMKQDRDQNFIEKNDAGTTVNRWLTTGMLAASATTNETAFLTYKVVRSMGMVVFDNQARV